MAENSKIEWCHHTVNFWWGCEKVSPACANCYAEKQDAHFHPSIAWQDRFQDENASASHWGPAAPRLIRFEAARCEAWRYERRAAAEGTRFRIFTNSMSDLFEDRRDLDHARLQALDTMRLTPNLDWLVLTKRPDKVRALLDRAERVALGTGFSDWLRSWLSGTPPMNVWLGTTVEDQARAEERIPALLQVPAAVRFLSCEPLLGPVDLDLPRCEIHGRDELSLGGTFCTECAADGASGELVFGAWLDPLNEGIAWVICGGESGAAARPMHPDWARALRDQCAAAGVPFLFKQWGEWIGAEYDKAKGKVVCQSTKDGQKVGRIYWTNPGCPTTQVWGPRNHYWDHASSRVGKKSAGRLLDGIQHDGYPGVCPGPTGKHKFTDLDGQNCIYCGEIASAHLRDRTH